MEGNDRAVAGIFLYPLYYLLSTTLGAIVASHKIPHDDAVALAQHLILLGAHDAMRGAKQIGGEVAICLIGISNVAVGALFVALEVVVGVIAYAMSTLYYHLIFIGVFAYIFAHHEEGRFDVVLIQYVEYPRGNLGDRAIIKGQVYGFF